MRNPWTREHDVQLVAMRNASPPATFSEIGEKLGRAAQSCVNHYALLVKRGEAARQEKETTKTALPPRSAAPERKPRKCLGCLQPFTPIRDEHFHKRCREASLRESDAGIFSGHQFGGGSSRMKAGAP